MDDKISGQPPMLLRPMGVSDEEQARAAHRELAQDAFDFLLDLKRGEPWPAYLWRLEALRLGVDVPPGWVPATFLIAEIDRRVVGRVSIRHQLNPYLAEVAGHIGIGVRPDFRRRGYATAILRQSLAVAASTGLAHVLVTCDANNVGSITVIKDCGGILEDPAKDRRTVPKCRFWVKASPRSMPSRRPTRPAVTYPLPAGDSEATSRLATPAEPDPPDSAAPVSPTEQRDRSPKHVFGKPMEQRVSFIRLGVADVKRSRAFYERLGWQGQDVEGTVSFRVGGITLVISGRDKLSVNAGIHDEQAGGFSGVVLAHNVRSQVEVEDVIASAAQAGARLTRPATPTSNGGYSGCFTDPDGHAWEIAHDPGFPLTEVALTIAPDFSGR